MLNAPTIITKARKPATNLIKFLLIITSPRYNYKTNSIKSKIFLPNSTFISQKSFFR